MSDVQEWRRLAWALGADDCGTDEPVEGDDELMDWRDWAERVHGPAARTFIAAADALDRIRGVVRTSVESLTDLGLDVDLPASDPRCSCLTFEPLSLAGVYNPSCVLHGPAVIERQLSAHDTLDAVESLVEVLDRPDELKDRVSEVLVRLRPWLRGVVDPGAEGHGSPRDVRGFTHSDSPSVAPGAGHTRDEATVGDASDTARDDSPRAVPDGTLESFAFGEELSDVAPSDGVPAGAGVPGADEAPVGRGPAARHASPEPGRTEIPAPDTPAGRWHRLQLAAYGLSDLIGDVIRRLPVGAAELRMIGAGAVVDSIAAELHRLVSDYRAEAGEPR